MNTKHTQEQASELHDMRLTTISKEAFLAFVDNNCYATETLEKLLEQAQATYVGQFKSFTELAEQQVDEGQWGEIPEHLANYIDCEKIGRDLRLSGDFWENNGHFFSNAY